MDNSIFEDLHTEGLIGDDTIGSIRKKHSLALFSIHWELKILLYLGVMMLSTGLGILIYKNIDTISHQGLLAGIGLLSIICFIWCYRNKERFSPEKVESTNSLFDYILLLGTLSFLSFVGYLQFQYEVFGTLYGMATFFPMLVLFITAYYFDHLGILTMAIANLALWMGISVTPKQLLESGDFNNERAIYTYFVLGIFLLGLGYGSERYHFKKHFFFTYHHFGIHLTFISLISGYFFYGYLPSLIWLMSIATTAWFLYRDALKHKSFYFILLIVLYSYIAFSGFVNRSLFKFSFGATVYVSYVYFILSAYILVRLLMYLNRKVKAL